MKFLDREEEMRRLEALARHPEGGLVVVYGRRRVGKTRLLLEWSARIGGLYYVADQSTAEVQRRYFAHCASQILPGFDEVSYPDWRALLSRLAREASAARWRGPVILDELPYLVQSAPEVPSVLQQWIDHEARQAGLAVALAGSSQRMMQGLVLDANAALFGRARELFAVQPLDVNWMPAALGTRGAVDLMEHFAGLGGLPRYWELASSCTGSIAQKLDRLMLDPAGPLHSEPDRLLLEELPPAVELRPILDAIGMGAHRMSEIAGRIGHQTTSLARPMRRLLDLGLAIREIPFGDSEKTGRRSLYKIADPFVRLWFRVVAPNRGLLASASPSQRLALLRRHWDEHVAGVWEELCRARLSTLPGGKVATSGPWVRVARWWQAGQPEWDAVSESRLDGRLLLAEAKWSRRPFSVRRISELAFALARRPAPAGLSATGADSAPVRVLLVPEVEAGVPTVLHGVQVVTARNLLPQCRLRSR